MKQRSLNIRIFNNMFIESFVLTFLQWIFTFIVPNANEPLISHSVVVLSLFQMSPQSFKGNFEPLQKCLLLGIFLTDMWGSAKRIDLSRCISVGGCSGNTCQSAAWHLRLFLYQAWFLCVRRAHFWHLTSLSFHVLSWEIHAYIMIASLHASHMWAGNQRGSWAVRRCHICRRRKEGEKLAAAAFR